MEKLQRFCAALFLALSVTLSAFAGEIPTPGAKTSTSQQQTSVTGETSYQEETSTGEIPTPGAIDPVTEAALSLLQGLLTLF